MLDPTWAATNNHRLRGLVLVVGGPVTTGHGVPTHGKRCAAFWPNRDLGGLRFCDLIWEVEPEPFSSRQVGLACAWRCRVHGTPDEEPAPRRREFC
jgi:hypothetical protein